MGGVLLSSSAPCFEIMEYTGLIEIGEVAHILTSLKLGRVHLLGETKFRFSYINRCPGGNAVTTAINMNRCARGAQDRHGSLSDNASPSPHLILL